MQSLERYFYLIVFNAYLHEQVTFFSPLNIHVFIDIQ